MDPSGDPVRIANEQGIPTLHAFFNEETAGIMKRTTGAVRGLLDRAKKELRNALERASKYLSSK